MAAEDGERKRAGRTDAPYTGEKPDVGAGDVSACVRMGVHVHR